MDEITRARFREALGGPVDRSLNPARAEQVEELVRIAADAGLALELSSRGADAPAAGREVVLSLAKLETVEVAEAALTMRAEAGATARAVAAAAAAKGLAVVGLPAGQEDERIGSLVARGALPRRSLCGIEIVDPEGRAVRSGGTVLKDVVGYDLPALMLGSAGRLGAVVAVHLRLAPAKASLPPLPAAPGIREGDGLEAGLRPPGLRSA